MAWIEVNQLYNLHSDLTWRRTVRTSLA